jgi:hypothetical protein
MSGDTSGVLQLASNNGTTAVTIDTSQNVGIGTTSPSAIGKVLNLYGSASVGSSVALQADNGAQFCTIYQGPTAADPTAIFSNNGFKFATATAKDATGFSEKMRIDSSGKVGIGTTSPTGILNVKGTGGDALPATSGSTQSAGLITRLQQGGGIGSVMDIGGNGGTGSWIQVTEASNLATNYNLMLNPNGGNLLVGTTARNGSEKMALWYSSNSGPGLNIRDTTAQNGNTFIQFNNGGTTAGAITSNGTTTMTYGSASDYRLKKDLVPMVGALEKIALLQPKIGKWIGDDSDFIGFVAHEIQEVFPDAVVGEKDRTDEQGNPVYQMIDTGTASLVATLTAAIQELKAELDELKAKVNA